MDVSLGITAHRPLSEMNKEEIIKELLAHQREALEELTQEHLTKHLIHFRTARFNRMQYKNAGIDSDGPTGLEATPIGEGHYL